MTRPTEPRSWSAAAPPPPHRSNVAFYRGQAHACQAARAEIRNARLRSMLAEERELWLMLAAESEAIDATVRLLNCETPAD